MTRISPLSQHDERLLTPHTGSISPAMDYTIILVGVLARVDAGYLFLRCIRSPDSEEDRRHVNCWGTCPTLHLLLADGMIATVVQSWNLTEPFTYRPIADFHRAR
jgi:hypothetical protein